MEDPKFPYHFVAALLLLLSGLGSAAAQPGPAVVSGTVTEAGTGAPLADVHVFLAGTTHGTVTDRAGRFRLDRLPPGAHTLYASRLGYAPARRDTLLQPDGTYTFTLALRPVVLAGPEVTVTAERAPHWAKRLRKFERLFLGETPYADSTRLLNPGVLAFDATWWGRLETTARAPLQIENRALGYRVTYFLEAFTASGGTIRYDGEPLFEALTPTGPEEAARWAANRRRAYHGSFQHLMQALLAGRVEAEGFTLYHAPASDALAPAAHRFRIDPAHLLEDGPTPDARMLRFYGRIEVVYAGETEDAAYLAWQHGTTWRRPGPQRSWIELTDGPTLVDHTGEVVDPYGVTVYGYFAFERVADALPRAYRP